MKKRKHNIKGGLITLSILICGLLADGAFKTGNTVLLTICLTWVMLVAIANI
jgi:hypothetical protein